MWSIMSRRYTTGRGPEVTIERWPKDVTFGIWRPLDAIPHGGRRTEKTMPAFSRIRTQTLLMAAICCLACRSAPAQTAPKTPAAAERDGQHDFDFMSAPGTST